MSGNRGRAKGRTKMMDLGMPSDLTFYKLLKEQGSVLAGILALLAGLAAYCAGRRQAKAVEAQNRGLKQSERCRLSRETLIAIGLIDGLLADALRNVDAIPTFGDGQEQRNVSTTLIQPGSEFRLGSSVSIERLLCGQAGWRFVRAWSLEDRTAVVRGSARRYVTERSGGGPWSEGRRRLSIPVAVPGRRKARVGSMTSREPGSAFRRCFWAWAG